MSESNRLFDQPEYVLFSTTRIDEAGQDAYEGRWRIMLGNPDGEVVLDVEEAESDFEGDRLELLSVIRGLEALDQPSQVRLFTNSRYVQRGLRYGIDSWRRSKWCWERFGRMVPIKNDDLWQRLDQALQFHQLECRYWRFEGTSEEPEESDQQDAAAA